VRVAAGFVAVFVCSTAFAPTLPVQRALSFEERVNAQAAIERVYYAHQIGATKPFEEAVPRSVLESKVRKYLEQTAALQTYWKTSITDDTLQRELERMAQGSRMPERLRELYTALGNDPFLIKECLARATLVDRLTHNFFEFDPAMHLSERTKADALQTQLASGKLSPSIDRPDRTVVHFAIGEDKVGEARPGPSLEQRLTPEEFRKRRAELPPRAGQVSDVLETPDTYAVNIVLSETPAEARVARYVVPKITWDEWWATARRPLTTDSVQSVASSRVGSPIQRYGLPLSPRVTCPGDDTWESWTLREVPAPRRSHTAVWTGSVMVVWGGLAYIQVNTGSRYDPATDTWLSVATTGAPVARDLHRAVWTGTSMMVWGGRGTSNAILGDGGRYDPIADAWLPISNVGAPSARTNHTAIWTGSRMIVWGGGTATGGLYDPANDTWAPTSMVNAPTPRFSHTAVWTGSKMIVWGGSATPTGALYDPVNDSWAPTATLNAPAARAGHSAVWTGSLMIVWGGGSSPAIFNTGGRYDPVNDSWTPTSTTNTPSIRGGHKAVWSGTVMIVWGGNVFDPSGESVSYPTDGGRYDPVGDTWTPTSLLGVPSGRSGHTMIWTGNSMIVWGGVRLEGPELTSVPLDTGARYDPATDSWTPTSLAGTPRGRRAHSAIWTGNVMVVWGGSDGNTHFNTGGRYDPVIDDWAGTSTAGAPSGRDLHSAAWTGDSMVIWGGEAYPQGAFASGGRYDPIANAWSPTSTIGAPSKRAGAATVWTGREMLVWGGIDNWAYPSTGGRYNPSTDTWSSMSTVGAPIGRYYTSAVWTGRLMVVWGGEGAAHTYVNTGGRYDPARDRWTATSLVDVPAGRWLHSTVWTGRDMVVWGGDRFEQDGTQVVFNDGSRYDPDSNVWTPTSSVGAPTLRADHSAVWTGREMVVWGGFGGDAFLETGGRYDPSQDAWRATSTLGAPSQRTGHSAVWTGSEMLVWGGYENASPFILLNTGGTYRATPGELCNGADDDCDGAIDEGGDALCDDGNPCTDDSCHGSAGCVHTPNVEPCDDQNPCTGADTCGDGACAGTPLTGTACDDGNACTVNDSCSGGQCAGGPPRICEDGNLCTDDSCNPATGCFVVGPRDCNDHNDCTDDSCNPATGCAYVVNGNEFCDDGSPCTHDDRCEDGHCVAEVPCDDHNPCTDDICYPWGCYWEPNSAPCDDGYECTVDDVCYYGYCRGTPTYGDCDDHDMCTIADVCNGYTCYGTYRDCEDGNQCTDDRCNPATGECIHDNDDWNYCTDDDPCTVGEVCRSGVCTDATPLDCFTCPDGFETIGAYCRRTVLLYGEVLYNQSPVCGTAAIRINDCEGGDFGFRLPDPGDRLIPVKFDLQFWSGISCNGGTSTVMLNGTPFGSFLTGGQCSCYPFAQRITFSDVDASAFIAGGINTFSIVPAGDCGGLMAQFDESYNFGRLTVIYAPHDRRCEVQACEPATGACSFSPLPDGTTCGDACTEPGACTGGACEAPAIDCDDGNVCTDDSCDPATGCVSTANNISCDDGNACTIGDSCSAGACVAGAPNTCDDHSPCTDDSCNASTGCVHTVLQGSCDDGNQCTSSDHCVTGHCVGTPASGIPCDDGDACFSGETCSAGICYGGTTEIDCDDHNVCTDDWCDHQLGCFNDSSQSGDLCDDGDPCTANSCDPLYGCVFPPGNEGAACDDADVCTQSDRCDAHGGCRGQSVCDDRNPCTDDYASGSSCACSHEPTHTGTFCSDGDACTVGEACDGNGTPSSCGGGTLVNCDDGNPCTTDTCDQATGCVHTDNAEPCDDGNPCTLDFCDPAIGCVNRPYSAGTSCSDGNACNGVETCDGAGACTASSPVACTALDQCHTAGVCDPASGACSNPIATNGTVCNDGSLCTTGETCQSGACTPAFSGLNEPNPRSSGYYMRLCLGPHSGDLLTDADAVCVGQVAGTFAGIATVADVCGMLRPAHPNNDACGRTSADLMVLALNICRARVCTAQSIDSQCGDNSNVGESLVESDAILLSPSRDDTTCAYAKCLDEEINTGRALELNTLGLRREGSGIRLDWQPPYLDDGTGHPSKYHVWRRVQGSLAPFAKVGTTTNPTYLDASSGNGAFEYEVTAVMN
jgi:N-acetylneuraminic acid mutarotase